MYSFLNDEQLSYPVSANLVAQWFIREKQRKEGPLDSIRPRTDNIFRP